VTGFGWVGEFKGLDLMLQEVGESKQSSRLACYGTNFLNSNVAFDTEDLGLSTFGVSHTPFGGFGYFTEYKDIQIWIYCVENLPGRSVHLVGS